VKRAVIIAPAWIGDAVLSQPMLSRLHTLHAGLQIDVVAPPWVMPVYRRMTEVAKVIENPFGHGDLQLMARRAFGKTVLRSGNYDRAFVLPNSLKSALITWFADIPNTTGFRGEARTWLLSDCRLLDEQTMPTMAERFASLAESPGSPLHRPAATPSLNIDGKNRADVMRRLGLDHHKPIVAVCPGAEYGPAKRWPPAHFAAYAKQQIAAGHQVWIFGGKADHIIGEEINRLSDNTCRNLCGETALVDAIDLLSLAKLVVTNDSGLMHIACAVGALVVALYGSSSPDFTPPLSAAARIVNLKIACSPCFQRTCPLGHFKCMNDITPEMVGGTTPTVGLSADDTHAVGA
jgi:heptosyltransferase-2